MSEFGARNYLPWLRICFTLIVTFLLLRFIIYPISQGYAYFINYTVELLHHQKTEDYIRERFPESKFQPLRLAIYAFGILLTALLILANVKGKFTDKLLKRLSAYLPKPTVLIAYWRSLLPAVKFWLIIIIGISVFQSLYFAINRPITGDEAYTYLAFIHNGPFVSAVFYPFPNNHVLFSILAYPFSLLPLPLEIQIRLPSIIFSVLSIVALYRLLSSYVDELIAVAACGMFAFLYPVYLYSHLARGYSLYLLFGILSLHFLLKTLAESRKKYWLYFVLFSVAGLYCIPSYLYGLMGMAVPAFIYLSFKKNIHSILKLLLSGISIGIISLLLYLPIIVVAGGWNAFLKVLFTDFEERVSFTKEAIQFVFRNHYAFQFSGSGIIAIFFLISSIVLAAVVYRKKQPNNQYRLLMLFALINFTIPLMILLLQHKLPYGRVTIMLSAYFAIILALLMENLFPKNASKYWLAVPALAMLIVNITLGWKLLPSNKAVTIAEHSSKAMANMMLSHKVSSCCNMGEPTYNITIAAYYAANDQSILFDNTPAVPLNSNAELPGKSFDCFIIPDTSPELQHIVENQYKPVYKNNNITLFIKSGDN